MPQLECLRLSMACAFVGKRCAEKGGRLSDDVVKWRTLERAKVEDFNHHVCTEKRHTGLDASKNEKLCAHFVEHHDQADTSSHVDSLISHTRHLDCAILLTERRTDASCAYDT